jgi:Na+-driven multidrug efflux pump
MTSSLIGSFSNIVLDYIFIFPMKMGIFGAILATGLAPVISVGVMLPSLISGRQSFRLDLSRPDGADILSVHRLGFPSFVVEISSGIVIVLYNYIILGLKGDVGVAAYGVVANISVVQLLSLRESLRVCNPFAARLLVEDIFLLRHGLRTTLWELPLLWRLFCMG